MAVCGENRPSGASIPPRGVGVTAAVPVLREVRLYGALGRRFGRVFRLAVLTPTEAVRALCAVLPGFRAAFVPDGRAAYHVFVGRGAERTAIALEQAGDPVGAAEPIRIVPVVEGAKRGGALQIVLGAALVLAAPYLGPALFNAGAGIHTALAVQAGAATIGRTLILGGIVQVLSPQRRVSAEQRADNLPSYGYDSGPVNTTQQGLPVPLAFGRVVVGSAVISAGLATEELVLAVAPPPLPPQPLPAWQPQNPGAEDYGGGQ